MTEELKNNLEIALEKRARHLEATKADGRQLVSIRKIDDLIPIPGADRIITAQIGGWPCVVKNNEFVPGELGLYFEPDSFLDAEDPRYAFLADGKIEWKGIEGIRLKAIKLRKQLSQGLLLPLSLFPEIAQLSSDGKTYFITIPDDNDEGTKVETTIPRFADPASDEYEFVKKLNFTTFLGVIKWEKIEKSSGGANLAGKSSGTFPPFLRKSDQPRCQNMAREIFGYEAREVPMDPDMQAAMPQEAIDSLIAEGRARMDGDTLVRIFPPAADPEERFEVTMKMDGSSMTTYALLVRDVDGVDRYKFGVCSRNQELQAQDLTDLTAENGFTTFEPGARYENEGNAFVDTFRSKVLPIIRMLPQNIALQGELLGPGIQGDYEKVGEKTGEYIFMVYNVFDIDQEVNLLPGDRRSLIENLNDMAAQAVLGLRIQEVPVQAWNVRLCDLGITNMQELLAYAEGPGLYQPVREGFVFKSMTRNEFQFKAISNAYELKKG